MNNVQISGNLAKDPVVRFSPSGKVVCQIVIATERPFLNQEGVKDVDFIPAVIWDKQAEIAGNTLRKGNKVLVEGRLQVRNYIDKDNIKRYVTEIVVKHFEYMFSKPTDSTKEVPPFAGEKIPFGDIEDIPF